MKEITNESYARTAEILEDISYSCEVNDYYEDWEEIARSSFAAFLDDLDAERFDMTCEVIRENILDNFMSGSRNYAKGIRTAFYGYLCERRDYLDFNEDYDKPELPENTDENDASRYEEEMELYNRKKEYNDFVEKWIDKIGKITFGEGV